MPALGFALAAVIWAAIGLVIRADFARQAKEADRGTANIARMLEAQFAARLDAVDSTLRLAQSLYAQDPANFSIGAWSAMGRDPDRVSVVLVGPDGFARRSMDGVLPEPVDLRARPGVATQLADPAADRLWISTPTIGPVSGRRIIAFSRPLHDAAGRFGGVFLISVDTDSFSRLFRALDIPGGSVSLFGLDGIVRARAPETDSFLGTEVSEPFVAPFRADATQIVTRGASPLDAGDYFNALRRVDRYPLIIGVSFSADEALAEAEATATGLVVSGALLTVLIVVICAAVVYSRRAGRHASAALEVAFAHAGHGIMLIGSDLRVVVANRRVSEMLDLPPGFLVPGRRFSDVVNWQLQTQEFGGGPPPTQAVPGGRQAGDLTVQTYDRARPNGTILRIRTDPLPDGRYVRSYTDVTESGRATAAIAAARDAAEAAQATLAAALLNVQHGVMLVGTDNRVQLINEHAIDLLGLPPELSVAGVDVAQIQRFQIARGDLADVPESAMTALAKTRTEPPLPGTVFPIEVYQRRTHDERFIEVRGTFLSNGSFIRTFTDVTAHRAALRAEAAARSAAEAALRSRTEFLAVVTHELRTPLNGIIGLTGLLLSRSPAPEQVSDLGMVAEAGKQLLAAVDDILRVAQLERGRLVLQEQRFDVRTLVRDMVALMMPRAEAKGLSIDLRIDAALPLYVIGDEERLRETLVKLLDNAVKFTDAGSITIAAEILAQDIAGCRLAISVADTGIGMEPEATGRLFHPFVQADGAYNRRFGGLGLGLAICRLMVEAMNGTITAESRPGSGSVFRVTVPFPSTYVPARADSDPGIAQAG